MATGWTEAPFSHRHAEWFRGTLRVDGECVATQRVALGVAARSLASRGRRADRRDWWHGVRNWITAVPTSGGRRSVRERSEGVVVVQLNPAWSRPSASGRAPVDSCYLSALHDLRITAALSFDGSTRVMRRIPRRFVRAGAAPCFARVNASTSSTEQSVAHLADTSASSMRPRGVSGHVVGDEHRVRTSNWYAWGRLQTCELLHTVSGTRSHAFGASRRALLVYRIRQILRRCR